MKTTLQQASLLAATPLLDFSHPSIQALIAQRGWAKLTEFERIGAVYAFVRNELLFGYNTADDLPASRVLADGIGQCNTKTTLLMALLRALGIPSRVHGFTIDKALQKGAITGMAYLMAPKNIIHTWAEVWFDGRWVNLEGVILDSPYLASLQQRFRGSQSFCAYGAATPDLSCPPVEWSGSDTYIQNEGINQDFGVFDSPDDFYALRGSNLSGIRRWIFEHVVRHWMNSNVARVRNGVW